MSKRVLVMTPLIRAGGGPAGYVYNQMLGYDAMRRAGKVTNEFVFTGKQGPSDRKPGEIASSAKAKLKEVITACGVKRFAMDVRAVLSSNTRLIVKQIKEADVVIFQGCYNTNLTKYVQRRSHLVYMAHSPSIMADEYRDLLKDRGVTIGTRYYENLRSEERAIIRRADSVVFPSPGASTNYRQHFTADFADKMVMIKSGAPIPNFQSGTQSDIFDSGKISVLFAGRYVSHRGYDLFCQAAEALAGMAPEIGFYSAGTGPLTKTTPMVRDLGWREDIFDIIRSADIIVSPNRISYYDLSTLECAGCGKPMIMTRVGGNADQIDDLPDVVPCAPTVEGVAEAIQHAAGLFRTTVGWGERNRLAYQALFTPEKLAQRWDEYITSLPLKRAISN